MDTRLTSESLAMPGPLEAIEAFFENDWSDGLPVVPPTPESVSAMLAGAELTPDEILGIEPVKGAVVTAEKAAINAVMAGCKPEYMPVVAAAVDAITQPEFNLHGITVSTMGASIMLVVGGPIAKQIGLNGSVSAFGPGYRANATIGRAIRLIVMNVLGTRSNDGLDKATLGHPGKYTWCFSENEERRPWEALHVTRGLELEDSAITAFSSLSGAQFGDHESNTPEGILDSFAQRLYPLGPQLTEIVLAICPEHAEHFERENWKKEHIGQYLFENATKTTEEWAVMGLAVGPEQSPVSGASNDDETVSALLSPGSAIPLVVGGDGGGWSSVIPTWSLGSRSKVVTRKVRTVG